MNPWLGIVEGVREILTHKLRSLLSISGIVLGVTSLMAMFALTAGTTEGIRAAILASGGVERVHVINAELPVEQEAIAEISPGRTYRDVQALRDGAPLLELVAGEKKAPPGIFITRKDYEVNTNNVRGVEPGAIIFDRQEVVRGRFICRLDVEKRVQVAVLGSGIYDTLWPEGVENAVGQNIKIAGQSFRVIGLTRKTDFPWINDNIYIPLSTMQDMFYGSNVQNGVDLGPDLTLSDINVRVRDIKKFDQTIEQMRNILNITHRGIQDFGFGTREDMFDAVENTVRGTVLSGGLVAGVTLIAGGVGITNIMLASIKERTREIGVRRAIGATSLDVFVQITIESLMLAVIGGLLGLVFGWGLIEVLKKIATSEYKPLVIPANVIFSFGAAFGVGVVAGLFPAWRASNLRPIEALRFE